MKIRACLGRNKNSRSSRRKKAFCFWWNKKGSLHQVFAIFVQNMVGMVIWLHQIWRQYLKNSGREDNKSFNRKHRASSWECCWDFSNSRTEAYWPRTVKRNRLWNNNKWMLIFLTKYVSPKRLTFILMGFRKSQTDCFHNFSIFCTFFWSAGSIGPYFFKTAAG